MSPAVNEAQTKHLYRPIVAPDNSPVLCSVHADPWGGLPRHKRIERKLVTNNCLFTPSNVRIHPVGVQEIVQPILQKRVCCRSVAQQDHASVECIVVAIPRHMATASEPVSERLGELRLYKVGEAVCLDGHVCGGVARKERQRAPQPHHIRVCPYDLLEVEVFHQRTSQVNLQDCISYCTTVSCCSLLLWTNIRHRSCHAMSFCNDLVHRWLKYCMGYTYTGRDTIDAG